MKFSTTVALAFAGFAAAGTIPANLFGTINEILTTAKTTLDTNVGTVKAAMNCISASKAFDPTCMKSVVGSLLKFTNDLKATGLKLQDSFQNANTTLTTTDINSLISSLEKAKAISTTIFNATKTETSLVKTFSAMIAFMFKSQITASKAAGSLILGPLLTYASKVTGDGTMEAAEALAKLKSIIESFAPQAGTSPKPSPTSSSLAPSCTC